MIMKKLRAIILSLMVMSQVVQARNNAALFGVAAAAIAGAALIANSHREPRSDYHHHHKRHHTTHHKTHHKKTPIVITDEMKIQKSLSYLEFYKGKIDGKLNSYASRSAIKKMNKKYNISAGTTLDSRTWNELLYLAELFTMDKNLFSERNTKVAKGKQLQTALKVYGAYNSKVDGIVGSGTRKAIATYKNTEGLTPTTSLSPNERYNLINSAQKMNTKTIDEAIKDLSPQRKKVREEAVQNSQQKVQDTQQTNEDRVDSTHQDRSNDMLPSNGGE